MQHTKHEMLLNIRGHVFPTCVTYIAAKAKYKSKAKFLEYANKCELFIFFHKRATFFVCFSPSDVTYIAAKKHTATENKIPKHIP